MQTINREQSRTPSYGALLAGAAFVAALAFAAPGEAFAACGGGTGASTGTHAPSTGTGGTHSGSTPSAGSAGTSSCGASARRLERRRPHAFAGRGSHGRHYRQRREAERLDNFQPHRKHAHHLAHRSRRQHDKGRRRRGAYWRRWPLLPRGEAPLSGFARPAGKRPAFRRRPGCSRAVGDRRRNQRSRLRSGFDPIAKSLRESCSDLESSLRGALATKQSRGT